MLQSLAAPACSSCEDLNCANHREEMEECLPATGGGGGGKKAAKKDIVPGWSEFVKPYADGSKFWCSFWKSEGKPTLGQTYENMKLSKRQYKYAVRRLKRCNDTIQNNKFLAGVAGGKCDIFAEIRKFRGKSSTFSSRMDEEVGSKNIATHFAGIYSKLYNKVNNDELENQFWYK